MTDESMTREELEALLRANGQDEIADNLDDYIESALQYGLIEIVDDEEDDMVERDRMPVSEMHPADRDLVAAIVDNTKAAMRESMRGRRVDCMFADCPRRVISLYTTVEWEPDGRPRIEMYDDRGLCGTHARLIARLGEESADTAVLAEHGLRSVDGPESEGRG